MKQIITTVKTVLSKKTYLFLLFVVSALTFFFFIFVQVWTIPGNSFGFQVSILRAKDFVLLSILSWLDFFL